MQEKEIEKLEKELKKLNECDLKERENDLEDLKDRVENKALDLQIAKNECDDLETHLSEN